MLTTKYKNRPNRCENVDWSVLLKVWLFLIDRGLTSELTTNQKIGDELRLKAGTVKNARRALQKDFHAIMSRTVYEYDPESVFLFRCLGSEITATAWITDDRQSP